MLIDSAFVHSPLLFTTFVCDFSHTQPQYCFYVSFPRSLSMHMYDDCLEFPYISWGFHVLR